jgi:hypothetical protein
VKGPQTSRSCVALGKDSGFNFDETGFVMAAFLALLKDWKKAVAGFFAWRLS